MPSPDSLLSLAACGAFLLAFCCAVCTVEALGEIDPAGRRLPGSMARVIANALAGCFFIGAALYLVTV